MKKRFNRYLTGILSIIIIISSVFPGCVLAEDISELPMRERYNTGFLEEKIETVRAELNPFIKPMVSKPLRDAIDKISTMLASLPY